MARITIYEPLPDRTYFINIDVVRSYRMSELGATEEEDTYMIITTDVPENGGGRRLPYIVRTLSDVPDDGGPSSATNFNNLFNRWILWIKSDGGLGDESSSSSSSSSSSESSSSS